MNDCTCTPAHIDAECHRVIGSIPGKLAETGGDILRQFWELTLTRGAEHEPSCGLSPLRHKRGPKPSQLRARVRREPKCAAMSDRSFATFYGALLTLLALDRDGLPGHSAAEAEEMATRPNNTLNVCKFARIADARLFSAVVEHPEYFEGAA